MFPSSTDALAALTTMLICPLLLSNWLLAISVSAAAREPGTGSKRLTTDSTRQVCFLADAYVDASSILDGTSEIWKPGVFWRWNRGESMMRNDLGKLA